MENLENKIPEVYYDDTPATVSEATETHCAELREEPNASNGKAERPVPTQEEINAEAWQIMQYILKKHERTWKELAKYD